MRADSVEDVDGSELLVLFERGGDVSAIRVGHGGAARGRSSGLLPDGVAAHATSVLTRSCVYILLTIGAAESPT